MSILDYSIVFVYLIILVAIGFYFQRLAGTSIDAYFLGDRKLPWWVLGASGMASNLDVSGTMINVALIYALGASGFFIEIRGGIVLVMAFFMIFMGKWNRRSEAMTMAEWMRLRFGDGREGNIARISIAVATIIISIWIISYFAVGAGKFIGEFLELPALLGFSPEFWAAAIMIFLATIYTIASGLYGVVWTDVFQGVLIFVTVIGVCVISIIHCPLPETFNISMPLTDGGYTTLATTRSEWTTIWPGWNMNLPDNISYSIYNLFGIAILFYLIKTIIDGSAGVGGYMMQRFFAARTEQETGLLSLFWIFLLAFRWPFIAAIAIMGIWYGADSGMVIQDPERVLPSVINYLIPAGLKGLLVAGLMAAAMSTFDSLVNATASYWVKDIYQAYLNPKANERQLVWQSRISSLVVVTIGLFLTLNISSINDIWGWLTMSIGAGILVPLLIRWYWWRLNGYGFAAGILMGMIAAILQRIFFIDAKEYVAFIWVFVLSLMGTVAGTYLSKPTPLLVLTAFYKKTRPFGFWNPVRNTLTAAENQITRRENKRDIISILIAVPWQLNLFLFMMMVVIQSWDKVLYLGITLVILSVLLYSKWFRYLSDTRKVQ